MNFNFMHRNKKNYQHLHLTTLAHAVNNNRMLVLHVQITNNFLHITTYNDKRSFNKINVHLDSKGEINYHPCHNFVNILGVKNNSTVTMMTHFNDL